MQDAFVGTWEMLPEKNDYQLGEPPQSGLYTIAAANGGYQITMAWRDVEGVAKEAAYHGIADGIDYPLEPETGLDSMSMTRVSEKQLDSDAKKGDVVVAYASRILSDDGQQMTVTQSGMTPQGEPFTNTSIYMRRETA